MSCLHCPLAYFGSNFASNMYTFLAKMLLTIVTTAISKSNRNESVTIIVLKKEKRRKLKKLKFCERRSQTHS